MINHRIKDLRTKKGLNQTELAEKIGLNRSTIAAIELGNSNPTLKQLETLSNFFEVSADYLLTGKEGTDTITKEEQEIIEMYRKDNQLRDALKLMINVKKKVIEYAKSYKSNNLQSA